MAIVLLGTFYSSRLVPSDLTHSRSGKPQEALTLHVNMDTEKGRPDTGKNIHRFQIRKAKTMDLYPLQAYLTSQGPFETPVVEAISKF